MYRRVGIWWSKAAQSVVVGATYVHVATGGRYKVLDVARTIKFPRQDGGVLPWSEAVAYRCTKTGITWIRPVESFVEKGENFPGGRFVLKHPKRERK